MTLGQRIQELRRQAGLSQEGLGEKLGVSRQAVSKWESDSGVPELDTLIAMSRLFGVTLGSLLGVEEDGPEPEETSTPPAVDEEKLEEILRRYGEQIDRRDAAARKKRRLWLAVGGCAGLVLVLWAGIWLTGRLTDMRRDISSLNRQIFDMQDSVAGQINDISNQVKDILSEQGSQLSRSDWSIADFDLEEETVTLALSAALKSYAPGTKGQFTLCWDEGGQTESRATDWLDGPEFSGRLELPMGTDAQVIFRWQGEDGVLQEEAMTPVYGFARESFGLWTNGLTTMFQISDGLNLSTVMAEDNSGVIVGSAYPELLWPTQAELAVTIGGEEKVRETLTLLEQTDSDSWLFGTGKTYSMSLKYGKLAQFTLTVTDNKGGKTVFVQEVSTDRNGINFGPIGTMTD